MGAKGLALRLLHQVAKETRFRDWDIEPEKIYHHQLSLCH